MTSEELLHPQEAFEGDPDVVAPLQGYRTSPLTTGPVTKLVAYGGPQNTKDDDFAGIQAPLMYQQTGGYKDGLAGEWDPDAL